MLKIPRAKIVVYKASDGWRFKAKAGNNRTVDSSEEGHRQKQYQIKKAKKQHPDLPVFIETPDGLVLN